MNVHWLQIDFLADLDDIQPGRRVRAECGATGPAPALDDVAAPKWASGWMQAVTCPACLLKMNPDRRYLPSGIPEAEREALRERILAARAARIDRQMRQAQLDQAQHEMGTWADE